MPVEVGAELDILASSQCATYWLAGAVAIFTD
jgi:hypothetical protein